MSKMSVKQHRELGDALIQAEENLLRIRELLQTRPEKSLIDQAKQKLLTLRSEMENRFCHEHSLRSDCCHTYFGTEINRREFQSRADAALARTFSKGSE